MFPLKTNQGHFHLPLPHISMKGGQIFLLWAPVSSPRTFAFQSEISYDTNARTKPDKITLYKMKNATQTGTLIIQSRQYTSFASWSFSASASQIAGIPLLFQIKFSEVWGTNNRILSQYRSARRNSTYQTTWLHPAQQHWTVNTIHRHWESTTITIKRKTD